MERDMASGIDVIESNYESHLTRQGTEERESCLPGLI
jgi:hypothetical protein